MVDPLTTRGGERWSEGATSCQGMTRCRGGEPEGQVEDEGGAEVAPLQLGAAFLGQSHFDRNIEGTHDGIALFELGFGG